MKTKIQALTKLRPLERKMRTRIVALALTAATAIASLSAIVANSVAPSQAATTGDWSVWVNHDKHTTSFPTSKTYDSKICFYRARPRYTTTTANDKVTVTIQTDLCIPGNDNYFEQKKVNGKKCIKTNTDRWYMRAKVSGSSPTLSSGYSDPTSYAAGKKLKAETPVASGPWIYRNSSTTYRTPSTTMTLSLPRSHADRTVTISYNCYRQLPSATKIESQVTTTFKVSVPARPSYAVSYNANGGSGAPGNQTKWYGEALTLSGTKPTRTGYAFKNWNTVAGGTGTAYNPSSSYTGNTALSLYAQWTANKYTIKFNANGGTGTTADMSMTYGAAATALRANGFTRTGYTFSNWNTKANGTGTSYTNGQQVSNLVSTNNGSITLYAQWTANKYTIKYNGNGSTSGSMSNETRTYGAAAQPLATNAFSKDGATFTGWDTMADGSGTSYADGEKVNNLVSTNNGSITLYAQWSTNIYKVKFNPNGGTGTMPDQSIAYDKETALAANAFTKEGHSFVKWTANADGTGASYTNRQKVKNLLESGTYNLYAQWKIQTYTIAYDANGGAGAPASQTKTYGTDITLSDEQPIRHGYAFAGWANSATATTADFQPGASYSGNADATLYAVWAPAYVNLVFEANEGTGTMADQMIDTNVKQPLNANAFSRHNHFFQWWNTEEDDSGTIYIDQQIVQKVGGIPLGGALRLYAQWKLDPYAGKPYAILMDDGNLLFFRSDDTYENDTMMDEVTDTAGNKYSGRVFAGIEDMVPASAQDVPWHAYRQDIEQVSVAKGQKVRPKSCAWWFDGCPILEKADLSAFDTTQATSLSHMFSDCPSIRTIDMQAFETSGVTDMSHMVSGCSSLMSLNVSELDTSNVTTMSHMFAGCQSLKEADLSKFDTRNVTLMDGMFDGDESLSAIDTGSFDTGKVTDMSRMFAGCSTVTAIDVSKFSTASVASMSEMFAGCSSLTYLDMGMFTMAGSPQRAGMFTDTRELSYVRLGDAFLFGESTLLTPPGPPTVLDGDFLSSEDGLMEDQEGDDDDDEGDDADDGDDTGDDTGTGDTPGDGTGEEPGEDTGDDDTSDLDWAARDRSLSSGKWMKTDGAVPSLTAEELAATYSGTTAGMPGGWCWEPYGGDENFSEAGYVLFVGNGGSVEDARFCTYDFEGSVIIPPYAERTGYILTGWNTEIDGTGESYDTEEPQSLLEKGKAKVLFAQWKPAPAYRIEGAVYRIYADEDCLQLITEVTINEDGDSTPIALPVGNYWVKEYKSPSDYAVDPEPHKVTISANDTSDLAIDLSVDEEPLYGNLRLRKVSAAPEVTTGNINYEFGGAEYGVFNDEGCSERVGKLTCEDNGFSNTLERLDIGTYYLKEEKAPHGYKSDPEVHEVRVTANRTSTKVTNVELLEQPDDNTGDISVSKKVVGPNPDNKAFGFRATLSTPLDAPVTGTYGGATFANGICDFSLHDGEMWIASGIPAGYKWSVEETEANGFSASWDGPTSGTVPSRDGDEAIASGVHLIATNRAKSGSVSIQKKLRGAPTNPSDDDKLEWDFRIVLYDGNAPVRATYNGIRYDGENGHHFILGADESITFDGIPEGIRYSISEEETEGWSHEIENGEGIVSDAQTAKVAIWNTGDFTSVSIKKGNIAPPEFLPERSTLYSVAGAVYGLYTDENCETEIGQFTTGADGTSNVIGNITPGTYYIQELVAPKGLQIDNEIHDIAVTMDAEGTFDVADYIIGTDAITLSKVDSDTGDGLPQGKATFAGTEFTLRYYSENYATEAELPAQPTRTWVLATDENGIATFDQEHLVASKSDELYMLEGVPVIPLGTVAVSETKAPDGYLANSDVTIVPIREDEETDESEEIPTVKIRENVIRGGVKVAKRAEDTSAALPDAKFAIYNMSGHDVIVGGQAYHDGECCLTISSGTDGTAATEARALPYGDYTIIESEAPEGYSVSEEWQKDFSITEDGKTVDLTGDPCVDPVIPPQIRTFLTTDANPDTSIAEDETNDEALLDADNKRVSGDGTGTVTVTDTILYTDVTPGRTYTITSELHKVEGGSDKGPVGETKATELVPTSETGTVAIELPLDLSGIAPGTKIVAFETIKLGTLTVAEHADTNDMAQTVVVYNASIGTTLLDSDASHDHVLTKGEQSIELTDTVTYEGLIPGASYILKGAIQRVATDGTVTAVAGATGAKPFTASETGSGTVVIPMTVSPVPTENTKLVAYERLYLVTESGGNPQETQIATHENPDDAAQTVVIHKPTIATVLTTTEAEGGEKQKLFPMTTKGTLTDTVSYHDLVPGRTYVLAGTIHGRKDGKDIGAIGTEARRELTPDMSDGTATIDLPVDLEGHEDIEAMVAFEKLYLKTGSGSEGESEVASHEEIGDSDQSVTPFLPEVATTLVTKDGQEKQAFASETPIVTVTDTVAYAGLIPGKTYVVRGELHPVTEGGGGSAIAGSDGFKEFTPDATNGTIEVEMTFDMSKTEAAKAVAYERLYIKADASQGGGETLIAKHEDAHDDNQTIDIYRPSIATTLTYDKGQKDILPALGAKTITLTDRVEYADLMPNRRYRLKATLHRRGAQGDEGAIAGSTASITFMPSQKDGAVDVSIPLDLSAVAKGDVVAFEQLFITGNGEESDETGDELIARHENIGDPAQTVTVYEPGIGTRLATEDGYKDLTYHADGSATVVDTVSYQGLIPGRTYELQGELHLAVPAEGPASQTTDDGEGGTEPSEQPTAGGLSDGGLVEGSKASTEFVPKESDGITTIALPVPFPAVTQKRIVAFEKVLLKDDDGEAVTIGEHADINDENQGINLYEPSIATVLETGDEGFAKAIQVGYDKEGVLVDTVRYAGLIPGHTYQLRATLRSKADGSEIEGATGSRTFEVTETDGQTQVEIPIALAKIPAGGAVAYERLYLLDKDGEAGEEPVASHEDLNDEDQTVATSVPSIATSLTTANSEKVIIAENAGTVTLMDTVSYKGLIPGKEYVLSATPHVKNGDGEDGGPLSGGGTLTFIPQQPDGDVVVTITCDMSGFVGDALVAYEKLSLAGDVIATHEDINDENQTVTVSHPSVTTKLADGNGGKVASSKANDPKMVDIIDEVSYTGLIPGKHYEVVGTLHTRVGDTDAGEIASSKKSVPFTPDAPDGTVNVPMRISTGDATKTLVAFEELYIIDDSGQDGGNEGTPRLIAEHKDIHSEAQGFDVKIIPDTKDTGLANDSISKTPIVQAGVTVGAGGVIAIVSGIAGMHVLRRRRKVA